MTSKSPRPRAEAIRPLAPGRGDCFATDHITVEVRRVGYLHRATPDGAWDNGWRFFSGLESDEYTNDSGNVAIHDVNAIANYDPEIIPLLDAPTGSAFARDRSGQFVAVMFSASEE